MKKIVQIMFLVFSIGPGLLIGFFLGPEPSEFAKLYIPYDYGEIFGRGILVSGAIAFLFVNLYHEKLKSLVFTQVRTLIVVTFALFALSIVSFGVLHSQYVVTDPDPEADSSIGVLFPFWPNESLLLQVDGKYSKENCAKAVNRGIDDIQPVINEVPVAPLVTSATFFFFYQLIFTSFATAFGILSIYLANLDDLKEIEMLEKVIDELKRLPAAVPPTLEELIYERNTLIKLIGKIRTHLVIVTDVEKQFELEERLKVHEQRVDDLNQVIDEANSAD